LALLFTADEFGEGASYILEVLKDRGIQGAFFLTGNYLRDPANQQVVSQMIEGGHYVGPHSNKHLLYCDWTIRDSLLVTYQEFAEDLEKNYQELAKYGVDRLTARVFMPPYEWYNKQIVRWAEASGIQVVNFTPGLRTAADYTFPEMGTRYVSSDSIFKQVLLAEQERTSGLNGFLMLIHLGTDQRRTDKFYYRLPELIDTLRSMGYAFERADKLVQ